MMNLKFFGLVLSTSILPTFCLASNECVNTSGSIWKCTVLLKDGSEALSFGDSCEAAIRGTRNTCETGQCVAPQDLRCGNEITSRSADQAVERFAASSLSRSGDEYKMTIAQGAPAERSLRPLLPSWAALSDEMCKSALRRESLERLEEELSAALRLNDVSRHLKTDVAEIYLSGKRPLAAAKGLFKSRKRKFSTRGNKVTSRVHAPGFQETTVVMKSKDDREWIRIGRRFNQLPEVREEKGPAEIRNLVVVKSYEFGTDAESWKIEFDRDGIHHSSDNLQGLARAWVGSQCEKMRREQLQSEYGSVRKKNYIPELSQSDRRTKADGWVTIDESRFPARATSAEKLRIMRQQYEREMSSQAPRF